MYLIPFARLTLFSPKSPEAVSQLLLRAVPPNGTEPKISKHTHREYYGSIWKESFVIQRNLNYQNQLYLWHTISFNHEVNKVKDFLSKVVRAGSTSGTNVMIPPNSRCT